MTTFLSTVWYALLLWVGETLLIIWVYELPKTWSPDWWLMFSGLVILNHIILMALRRQAEIHQKLLPLQE